jgi:hypothetical protein
MLPELLAVGNARVQGIGLEVGREFRRTRTSDGQDGEKED